MTSTVASNNLTRRRNKTAAAEGGGCMFCHRCRGLLVHELFDELRGEIAHMHPTTRCINCGCINAPWFQGQSLVPSWDNLVGALPNGQEGIRPAPLKLL